MKRKFPLSFIACMMVVISFAQEAKEAIKVTDMLKIKAISNIVLTMDGSKAAFIVNEIEPDGDSKWDYKYVNHIYLVPTDGSAAPKELTVKESASQPAWSPDGKKLAFVRAAEGKAQIFLLSLDGGEPIQFTHFKYGASSPKWSPDGKKIMFASNIGLYDLIKDSLLNPDHQVPSWSFEKPGLDNKKALAPNKAEPNPDGNLDQIRAYLEKDVADKKAKVINKLNFQDEMGVNPDISFNHFFVQDLRPIKII